MAKKPTKKAARRQAASRAASQATVRPAAHPAACPTGPRDAQAASASSAHLGPEAFEPEKTPAPEAALRSLPAFGDLAPTAAQLRAFEDARASDARTSASGTSLELGFVARLDRGFPLVVCADKTLRAEHAVDFAKGAAARAGLLPTVGDWVAVATDPAHDHGVIAAVLPRRTSFARWQGGRRASFQTLAANLDALIVVAAVGESPLRLPRLARSLVLAADCGLSASVVLTKADRAADDASLARDIERVRRLAGEGVRVAVTSSAQGAGLAAVRDLVPARTLAMVLGQSGAGKSSLLNALVGEEVLPTFAVREKDDRGRHTTVARMMVKLPGAGVVCDAPGLRSLALVGHERGLDLVFPEIRAAAADCRFADCAHLSEPGCAVRAAVERGSIDPVRLEAYQALAAEMRAAAASLDPDVAL